MASPKCVYFGICGGCSTQSIDYDMQIERKKNNLKTLLKTELEISSFHGKEYNYRNKMEFTFHAGGIGLRSKKDSREIEDIHQCEIVDERINELLHELRGFFKIRIDAYDDRRKSGTFMQAVLRASSKDSSISFILYEESQRLGPAIEQIKLFAEKCSADNIIIAYQSDDERQVGEDDFFAVKGEPFLHEELSGKKFEYSTEGFFQNNTEVSGMMQEYCHSILQRYSDEGKTKDAHLLDLYGGVGTFGIINADLFKKTTIAEFSEQSIDAAKKNIEKNGMNPESVEAMVLDAKNLSKLKLDQPNQPLFIILDPPRSGMAEKTIEELKRLKPESMIYISCNPGQMAKDLQKFPRYELKSVAMFDLFPQTNHAEAIAELVLKPKGNENQK